jgi:hypothetical protein
MLVNIQCPACKGGKISIEPSMLVQGKSFSCTSCDAVVGVADSSKDTLAQGLADFNGLKQKVSSMKADGAQLN